MFFCAFMIPHFFTKQKQPRFGTDRKHCSRKLKQEKMLPYQVENSTTRNHTHILTNDATVSVLCSAAGNQTLLPVPLRAHAYQEIAHTPQRSKPRLGLNKSASRPRVTWSMRLHCNTRLSNLSSPLYPSLSHLQRYIPKLLSLYIYAYPLLHNTKCLSQLR